MSERGLGLSWCLRRSHHSFPLTAAAVPCPPLCSASLTLGGSAGSSNPPLSPPSYGLSCEIEPLSESASNTLKAKKNTGIIKRWSE